MLCYILIDNDKVIVPINEIQKSNFFCGLIETHNNNNIVNDDNDDITLSFPSQYNDVAHAYVNYVTRFATLGNNFSDKLGIQTKDELKQCFKMCHFLDDMNFFDLLIGRLFQSWSDMVDIIEQLHNELKRQIYLRVPFIFVPEYYQDNTLFFEQWTTNSNNMKYMILNHDGRDNSYISNYYEYNKGKSVIFRCSTLNSANFCLHGVQRQWEKNPETGLNTMIYDSKYEMGNKHGKQQRWYISGKLREITYFNNGFMVGEWKGWYDNGLPKYIYNYDGIGNQLGIFKQWLPDGTLKDDLIIDNTNRRRLEMTNSLESDLLVYLVY